MGSSTAPIDLTHEIATIRCLVAQQIQAMDHRDSGGTARREAEVLLRRFLRREEELRRRLAEASPAAEPRL